MFFKMVVRDPIKVEKYGDVWTLLQVGAERDFELDPKELYLTPELERLLVDLAPDFFREGIRFSEYHWNQACRNTEASYRFFDGDLGVFAEYRARLLKLKVGDEATALKFLGSSQKGTLRHGDLFGDSLGREVIKSLLVKCTLHGYKDPQFDENGRVDKFMLDGVLENLGRTNEFSAYDQGVHLMALSRVAESLGIERQFQKAMTRTGNLVTQVYNPTIERIAEASIDLRSVLDYVVVNQDGYLELLRSIGSPS